MTGYKDTEGEQLCTKAEASTKLCKQEAGGGHGVGQRGHRGSKTAILKAVTLTELVSPLSQSFLSGCGAAGLTSTHLVPALPFPATPAKNVSKCCQMS